MKETEVTAKIVRGLSGVPGCHAQKRHSGKFGSGDPDLSGVFNGTAFFIETKVEGGELTKLQAAKLDQWRKVGAKTFVAIYKPSTKMLKVIYIHDSEAWDQFTGREGLRVLAEESASAREVYLRDFHYSSFLVTM